MIVTEPNPVRVERMLAETDFEPDSFSNDTPVEEKLYGGPGSQSILGDRRLSIYKKDANWDFSDVENERPRVYVVEVRENSKV